MSLTFLQRRQQLLQQHSLSHMEGIGDSFGMPPMLSTFRRLKKFPTLWNGKQQHAAHFCPLVIGWLMDFPAIICALSDRVLPQHDDNPQQSFLFLVISFMLELKEWNRLSRNHWESFQLGRTPIDNFNFVVVFRLQRDIVNHFFSFFSHFNWKLRWNSINFHELSSPTTFFNGLPLTKWWNERNFKWNCSWGSDVVACKNFFPSRRVCVGDFILPIKTLSEVLAFKSGARNVKQWGLGMSDAIS